MEEQRRQKFSDNDIDHLIINYERWKDIGFSYTMDEVNKLFVHVS